MSACPHTDNPDKCTCGPDCGCKTVHRFETCGEKLDAIRELHQLKHDHYYQHDHFKVCAACHRQWPCPTVAILDREQP